MGVIIWSCGHDSVYASWIVRIINCHVSRKRAETLPPVSTSPVSVATLMTNVVIYGWWLIIVGSISRVNTSSVGGDTYDRNVVIYRWWLIVVRGGIIFIDI